MQAAPSSLAVLSSQLLTSPPTFSRHFFRPSGNKFRRSDQQFIELFVRKYPKILVRGVYLPQVPSAACTADVSLLQNDADSRQQKARESDALPVEQDR